MKMISVDNIERKYPGVEALKGISFEVDKGEIFGIIGPDGAGKTTLFRILTTLLLADSGTATVDGHDVVKAYKQIRRKVGYMPGRFSLYQDLSVEENLKIFATLFGTTVEQNYHLIKDIYIQLEPFKKRRAGALSGGMKQKLALCCALIHEPVVLFLDEPTTGVDPVSRKELWDVLKRLKKHGVTILVSTPYMDEANMCDRIALIQNGQFMEVDTPEQIINNYKQVLWSVRADEMSRLLKDLRQNEFIQSCYAFGDAHHVTMAPLPFENEQIFNQDKLKDFLVGCAHTNIEINTIQASIEDCFMELIA
jgi:ABC-type multidrug transport system ATPase subunit